jgi:hypothetical protein
MFFEAKFDYVSLSVGRLNLGIGSGVLVIRWGHDD